MPAYQNGNFFYGHFACNQSVYSNNRCLGIGATSEYIKNRRTSWFCLSLKAPWPLKKLLPRNILVSSCIVHCVRVMYSVQQHSVYIYNIYMYHGWLSGVSLSLTMIARREIVMTTNTKCACPLQRHRQQVDTAIEQRFHYLFCIHCYHCWLDVTKYIRGYIVDSSSSPSLSLFNSNNNNKKKWNYLYAGMCATLWLYALKKHSILYLVAVAVCCVHPFAFSHIWLPYRDCCLCLFYISKNLFGTIRWWIVAMV